jgi:hypothetical protein
LSLQGNLFLIIFDYAFVFPSLSLSVKIDPSLVQPGYGGVLPPARIEMKKSGDHLLEFSWDTTYDGGNSYDKAMLLACDVETGRVEMKLTGQFRSIGVHRMALPHIKNQNYHVYLAFVFHGQSRQSKSILSGICQYVELRYYRFSPPGLLPDSNHIS